MVSQTPLTFWGCVLSFCWIKALWILLDLCPVVSSSRVLCCLEHNIYNDNELVVSSIKIWQNCYFDHGVCWATTALVGMAVHSNALQNTISHINSHLGEIYNRWKKTWGNPTWTWGEYAKLQAHDWIQYCILKCDLFYFLCRFFENHMYNDLQIIITLYEKSLQFVVLFIMYLLLVKRNISIVCNTLYHHYIFLWCTMQSGAWWCNMNST